MTGPIPAQVVSEEALQARDVLAKFTLPGLLADPEPEFDPGTAALAVADGMVEALADAGLTFAAIPEGEDRGRWRWPVPPAAATTWWAKRRANPTCLTAAEIKALIDGHDEFAYGDDGRIDPDGECRWCECPAGGAWNHTDECPISASTDALIDAGLH